MKTAASIFFLICFSFLSCKSLVHSQDIEIGGQTDSLIVTLENESIVIPRYDSISHVDTIVIVIHNNTDNEYVFAMDKYDIGFTELPLDTDLVEEALFFLGLGCRFIDNENNALPISSYSGYNPDRVVEYSSKDKIHYVPANSKYKLNIILRFPFVDSMHDYYQQVSRLEETKSIELVFNPLPWLCGNYLKRHDLKLDENQKLLSLKKIFRLPTVLYANRTSGGVRGLK